MFANVHYSGGFALSTDLGFARPTQLGSPRPTLDPSQFLDSRTVAESWFYMSAHTDPNVVRRYVVVEEVAGDFIVRLDPDTFGDPMTLNIGSHILSDPQFSAPETMTLAFEWRGAVDSAGLSVTVSEEDWTPLAKAYSVKIEPDPGADGWTSTVLSRAIESIRRQIARHVAAARSNSNARKVFQGRPVSFATRTLDFRQGG